MAVSAKHDDLITGGATEGDWVEEPNYRRNGMTGCNASSATAKSYM
ncbi:hypothetical protein [Escherichia coli]|nr:Uncharacterised protein [Escherichia coli]